MSTNDSRRSEPSRRDVGMMGLAALLGAELLGAGSALAQQVGTEGKSELPALIPRTVIFGNPDRVSVQLSHDGRWLAWLSPANGVLNVSVAPVADLAAARTVTDATKRPVYGYIWAYDSRTILYVDDANGDENLRVYAVDVTNQAKRDLTPLTGVQAQLLGVSPKRRNVIAVGLNSRDVRWHDFWQLDITTGERRLVRENRDEISGYLVDQDLLPRLVTRSQPDGSDIIYEVKGEQLKPLLTIPFADSMTTGLRHITADGKACYLTSSIGRDRAALYRLDLETGAQTLVAEHAKADIGGTLVDPRTFEVAAASAEYVRDEWIPIDAKVGADLAWLNDQIKADLSIVSQTEEGTRWTISGSRPERPAVYYLFDRPDRRLTRLFTARPQLERFTLATMQGHVLRSRDGLELVSYLTLPANEGGQRPARPLPMVLVVHGGPWARDTYGYDPEHQWLANRGYAVLAVNYRGSSGFGKAFVNAGDLEWGAKMHDDLIDAVKWATAEGIAEPGRVAIFGASYGGYAALVGATFTPDAFRCAVSIVGPSNLETFIASIPPYWQSFYENLVRRIGDPRTEAGRALLKARSPLTRASAISKPLLVMQGANDPRVNKAESDQIVAAARARGLPVTYVLYPDEGHGFSIPANRISSYAIIEAFLAQHLGGARFEPIGNDLKGSALKVEGDRYVPGLEAGLAAR
ncbi:MAG: S9 family peptidase [Hyphomicrobiaceae bacterium]|nr:S9 family peptidase [Hyphomicrobiaceae bacterium]